MFHELSSHLTQNKTIWFSQFFLNIITFLQGKKKKKSTQTIHGTHPAHVPTTNKVHAGPLDSCSNFVPSFIHLFTDVADKDLTLESTRIWLKVKVYKDLPGGSEGKASACNAGDPGSIPGSGRYLGEGNGNPLQYSCLENPMDGGFW